MIRKVVRIMGYGKPKWVQDLQKRHEQMQKQNKLKTENPLLTQKDFYPPEDKRCLESGVEDIKDGDNFAEYAEYYFGIYSEES